MSLDNDALAEFVDRQTVQYVRFFPVEVRKVWRAVTTSEYLNIWMHPVVHVEPKLGGRCSFTWGSPDDPTFRGTVAVFEPMTRVRYELSSHQRLQFEMKPVEGGTHFTFTDHFGPDFRHDNDGAFEAKHGAQPAGPGTPWRAGFLAGFHLMFPSLTEILDDSWTEERVARESKKQVDQVNAGQMAHGGGNWNRLVELYYDHIIATYPKA